MAADATTALANKDNKELESKAAAWLAAWKNWRSTPRNPSPGSPRTAIACCWTVRAARPLRKPPSASLAVAAGAVVEEDREERSNVERPNATAVKPRQAKVQASQGAL